MQVTLFWKIHNTSVTTGSSTLKNYESDFYLTLHETQKQFKLQMIYFQLSSDLK